MHDTPPPPDTPLTARGWFDMGGTEAGPVLPDEHDFALWEKRVDALVILCQAEGLFTVDGLRRALEDMGPQAFETMTYYERWVASLRRNLVESGAVTPTEIAAKIDEIRARGLSYGEVTGHD
ncbi:MAG: ScnB-like protein [Pseudomonadota bacterium]